MNTRSYSELKIICLSCLLNFFILPPLKIILKESKIVEKLSIYFGIPNISVYIIVFFIFIIVFLLILSSEKVKNFFEKLRYILRWNFKNKINEYSGEERGSEDYKKIVIKYLKESQKVRFVLLSAYTMFYDEREFFIKDTLEKIPKEKRVQKEIIFLLLDPESREFNVRAKWFVKRISKLPTNDPRRVNNLEEYKNRCRSIIINLEKLGTVKYYCSIPIWRLQIFDRTVFVSTYGRERDGHLTNVLQFPAEHPMYDGFYKFFDSIYKRYDYHGLSQKDIEQKIIKLIEEDLNKIPSMRLINNIKNFMWRERIKKVDDLKQVLANKELIKKIKDEYFRIQKITISETDLIKFAYDIEKKKKKFEDVIPQEQLESFKNFFQMLEQNKKKEMKTDSQTLNQRVQAVINRLKSENKELGN